MSTDKHDAFLALLEEIGHEKEAAKRAGVQLTEIVRRARHDDEFAERLKDARALRRVHVRDALFEEGVLGREQVDITGKTTRIRDLKTLHAMARKLDELDPERPAAAVQVNTNVQAAAADPALVEFAKKQDAALRQLMAKAKQSVVIDVTPERPALPAADPDEDLLT